MLLAPRIVEPVSACCESVTVVEVAVGADVTIHIDAPDGAVIGGPIGTGRPFVTVPLTSAPDPGQKLYVTQQTATETQVTPSAAALVQPPADRLPPPIALRGIVPCMGCVGIGSVGTCATVEIRRGADVIGSGRANGTVARLFFSEPPEAGEELELRQFDCAGESDVRNVRVDDGSFPPDPPVPEVLGFEPGPPAQLMACEQGFPIGELEPGATVSIERGDGRIESFCATSVSVTNVTLSSILEPNEEIVVSQHYRLCMDAPTASTSAIAVEGPVPAPHLAAACDGALDVHLENLRIGAEIRIFRGEPDGELIGRTNASESAASFRVGPLAAGDRLYASQRLCERESRSNVIEVDPAPTPASIVKPRIVGPLFACTSQVVIEDLTPGSMVQLREGDEGRNTLGPRRRVSGMRERFAVSPPLVEGQQVQAWVEPCATGPEDMTRIVMSEFEPVLAGIEPPVPTVVARAGDAHLLASDLLQGAWVEVRDADKGWLGGDFVGVAEDMRVPLIRELDHTGDVGETLLVTQTLCARTSEPAKVDVLLPCPPPAVLLEPEADERWVERDTVFTWDDPGAGTIGAAEEFELQLLDDLAGAAAPLETVRTRNMEGRFRSLELGRRYRWTVRSANRDCANLERLPIPRFFTTRPEFGQVELVLQIVINDAFGMDRRLSIMIDEAVWTVTGPTGDQTATLGSMRTTGGSRRRSLDVRVTDDPTTRYEASLRLAWRVVTTDARIGDIEGVPRGPRTEGTRFTFSRDGRRTLVARLTAEFDPNTRTIVSDFVGPT